MNHQNEAAETAQIRDLLWQGYSAVHQAQLLRCSSIAINTTKTEAGERTIPMLDFVNRYGDVQHQATLNRAIHRLTRDCNDEVLLKHKGDSEPVLLPPLSCHILRHTFTTRLCEAGVNVKVIQDVLGHADFSTTSPSLLPFRLHYQNGLF